MTPTCVHRQRFAGRGSSTRTWPTTRGGRSSTTPGDDRPRWLRASCRSRVSGRSRCRPSFCRAPRTFRRIRTESSDEPAGDVRRKSPNIVDAFGSLNPYCRRQRYSPDFVASGPWPAVSVARSAERCGLPGHCQLTDLRAVQPRHGAVASTSVMPSPKAGVTVRMRQHSPNATACRPRCG